jgi:SsrA-binding protein
VRRPFRQRDTGSACAVGAPDVPISQRSACLQNVMTKKPSNAENGEKVLVKNRRAPFDYHLEARFEAGMVLVGSEVKSMRAGTVDITDAWASLERDGIYLKNLTVQPLPHAAYPHEPRRPRKLLLHTREIEEIRKAIDHDKKTLIPLRVYLKNGLIKTEIALATGKKKGDKRDAIRTREEKREAESAMRRGRKE